MGRLFREMMGVHEHLERLFAEHQDALVALDLDRAAEALARYDAEIRDHMRIEERVILPLYESRVEGAADAPLYRGEHRRLRLILDELRERVAGARAADGAERRRQVIEIFDREAVVKNLLEHHDAREGNVLYPALDLAVAPPERAEILDRVDRGELPDEDPPPAGRANGRRVTGLSVGLFVVAVRLTDDRVGLAPTPLADPADPVPDPEVLLGRDAVELAARRDDPSPLLAAIAAACGDALADVRPVFAPDRLLMMVGRGARLEQLERTYAAAPTVDRDRPGAARPS